MRAIHISIWMHNKNFFGSEEYDGDNMECKPAKIDIDNDAAISLARCDEDDAGNKHVT